MTSAASSRAAVIRQPSIDQIGATVAGLGCGAMNTVTVNMLRHARGAGRGRTAARPRPNNSVKSPASGLPAAKDVHRCA
jgi:hypothetical protein